MRFDDVPAGPLELRMSRSSPGRYALHEFAKNVFDVRVTDAAGAALPVARPNPHQWNVTGHHGSVRVAYRIFGDRVDGTYLGIDSTHAHINMPAALMWARGLELRPATVRFEPPPGVGLARRDAAAAWRRSVHVHRAEPAVPDGQPDGGQRVQSADVHARRRAAIAGRPPGRAPHGNRRGARRLRPRRRADRARSRPRLRRVPGVRGQHLHVHRRLPAVGERRRHGASQQHDRHEPELHPHQPPRSARHHLARVLPFVERRAHPPAFARAVQFRRRQHVGRAVAGGGLHQLLRSARDAARRPERGRRLHRGHGRGHQRRHVKPGAASAQRRGDEPHGAVRRSRGVDRSGRTSTTPSSPITRGERRSASGSISRFASAATARSRSTTSCARCGRSTASRVARRQATSTCRTRWPI